MLSCEHANVRAVQTLNNRVANSVIHLLGFDK